MSEPTPQKYKVEIHLPKTATGPSNIITEKTPAEYRKNSDPSEIPSKVFEIAEVHLPAMHLRPAALKKRNGKRESTGYHYLLSPTPADLNWMVPPETKAWKEAEVRYPDCSVNQALGINDNERERRLYFLGE
jgi:hypothetical protein